MIGLNSPILGIPQPITIPLRGFLFILKQWMGRIISTLPYLSSHIFKSAEKTQHITQPIFVDGNKKTFSQSPKHRSLSTILKSDNEILGKESPSITSKLFDQMGFDFNSNFIIFDLDQNQLTGVEIQALNGCFQIEWNHPEDETHSLIYKGNLKDGAYHGKGIFFTQDRNNGEMYLILDGQFANGLFVSGLLVKDNCIIDGTFLNGKEKGNGMIYFEEDSLIYRGEFDNGNAHGSGKLFLATANGMKIIGIGDYSYNKPIRGQFVKAIDDCELIYQGEFGKNATFKGTLHNFQKRMIYEGNTVEDKLQGQGKLTLLTSYTFDRLYEKTGVLEENIEGELKRILIGEFHDDRFYQGDEFIECSNGLKGKSHYENYERISPFEMTAPNELHYKGQFDLGTLDGVGSIFNPEGLEVYKGEIKCGFPHGQGVRKHPNEEAIEEGGFEWGVFKG